MGVYYFPIRRDHIEATQEAASSPAEAMLDQTEAGHVFTLDQAGTALQTEAAQEAIAFQREAGHA